MTDEPSTVTKWNDQKSKSIIALSTFGNGLQTLLDSLCHRPGRWILIVKDAQRPHLYWQALAFEDGSLITEVVSNYYLAVENHWTGEQESRLAKFGWQPPAPPRTTNWINVEHTTSPDTELTVCRAMATLQFVFGMTPNDELRVRTFSSPRRGSTPASAEIPGPSEAAVEYRQDPSEY